VGGHTQQNAFSESGIYVQCRPRTGPEIRLQIKREILSLYKKNARPTAENLRERPDARVG
jgi:hypothetical protein